MKCERILHWEKKNQHKRIQREKKNWHYPLSLQTYPEVYAVYDWAYFDSESVDSFMLRISLTGLFLNLYF